MADFRTSEFYTPQHLEALAKRVSDMVPWILMGFVVSNIIQWSPFIIMMGLTGFWLYRKATVDREQSLEEVKENANYYVNFAKTTYEKVRTLFFLRAVNKAMEKERLLQKQE
nr:hypothetical protein K-LCC10_0379 [Kaumoebavirus]